MRNSNNAMTFLLAQYRAIFKRAYFKGLATAVLMTAGLAAGAAQAAEISLGASLDEAKDVTVTGQDTFSGSTAQYAGTLTISGSGAKLTSDSTSNIVAQLYFKELNVTDGATLELTQNSSDHNGFQGLYTDPDFTEAASLANFNKATVTISGTTSIQATNVTMNDTTLTLEGSKAGLGAEDGDNNNPVAGRGELTITGSTITMSGTGVWMGGTKVAISDSTITLDGADSGSDAFAHLYAYGTQGEMDLTDVTLSVSDDKYGNLGAATLNLNNGTTITNSGTLILGQAGADNVVNLNDGAKVAIDGTAKGHIYAASDIVMTGGELSLVTTDGKFGLIGVSAPEDYSAGKLGTFDTDLTATGGKITVTKSQIQMNNITLGGEVEVTIGTNIGDKDSYWTDNALINAEDNTKEGQGNLTIDGATITMNAGSSLMGRTINMNAGAITLNGANNAYDSGESGSAMFFAYGVNGVMNLAGGSIAVDGNGEHGALRSKTLNLTGTEISVVSGGELTIAGVLDKAQSGANAVLADGGIAFNMTGGVINNAGTLNLGVVSGTAVNNSGSTFTIAGGTFSNAGKANVASGSTLALTGSTSLTPTITNSGIIEVQSGASFTTAGSFTLDGAGTLDFKSGATSISLAGENVVLNNKLAIAEDVSVAVAGKVTFNGDNSSGNKVYITGSGDVTIDSTGTLIINDAANTIGLSYTAGEAGALGSFSGASPLSMRTRLTRAIAPPSRKWIMR